MAEAATLAVILVAEDDSDDVFLLRRLLAKAGVKNPLVICRDGDELVAYLRPMTNSGYKGPHPCLVFLDIKMPRRDGFEVLRWIRKQAAFRTLPVVMLSGSDEARDHQRAAELGATGYLVKHPTPEVFAGLIAAHSIRR